MSYALQHGGGLSKGALTNWVLEGKLHHTDDSWCLLSEHVNDLRLSCIPTHGRAIGLWPLAVCYKHGTGGRNSCSQSSTFTYTP